MAVYYTDNINGNDATGDGSFANPFKSIYKGSQSISANGDEVRVMGSEFSAALPGTLTFTYNSDTITTSDDLTTFFPELVGTNDKVIITVDDEYGYGKTVCTVVAVTSTTLKLHSLWVGESTSFGVKRLNTQHYYATASPTSPAGSAGWYEDIDSTNVILYTDIKITGGWTAEGVQNGMTAFVSAFVSPTASSASAIRFTAGGASVHFGQDLLVSNFAATHLVNYMNTNQERMAWGIHWFIRISGTIYNGSNSAIWNDKLGSAIEIHAYDAIVQGSYAVNTGFTGGVPQQYKIWQTGSSFVSSKFSIPFDGKQILEYHVRFRATDKTLGFPSAVFLGNFCNLVKINDFYLYNHGTPGYLPLKSFVTTLYIAKVFSLGTSAATLSSLILSKGVATIGDGTQDLKDQFRAAWGVAPVTASTLDAESSNTAWRIRGLSNSILRSFSNVDKGTYAHNQFLLDVSKTVFDTGDSSLMVYPSYNAENNNTLNYLIPVGAIPAFNDERTLTVRMKTNGIDSSIWNLLQIAYANVIYASTAITVTDTWADYTLTATPSPTPDLNDVQYFTVSVRSEGNNTPSDSILYIDSISIA